MPQELLVDLRYQENAVDVYLVEKCNFTRARDERKTPLSVRSKNDKNIPLLWKLALTSVSQCTVQGRQLLPSNVPHQASGISTE